MNKAGKFWLYLLTTSVIVFGCAPPSRNVGQASELDTLSYDKYIVNVPDSSVYPILQQVSSQREPQEEYGLQQLFDSNPATSWQSEPGLHSGEWVSFQFQNLQVSRLSVQVSDTFLVAKVNQIEVWINDSLMGIFPSKSVIDFKGALNKLKIRAVDADGLNTVDLVPVQDTTSLKRIVYQKFSSYYNSKPFAIQEIELYNSLGKKMLIQAIPYRTAKISTRGYTNHAFLSDGNLSTGWSHPTLNEHRIDLIFGDFTPVTQVKLYNGIAFNHKIKGIQKCILSIPGRPEAQWVVKPGWNEHKLSMPLVGKMFTLRLISTQPMGLSELFFYDGARYFQPYADSIHIHNQQIKDTLAGTSIQSILNNRIRFKERIVVLKSDTITSTNYKELSVSELHGATTTSYDLILRANRTIELYTESVKEVYGKEIRITMENKLLTGWWKIKSHTTDGNVIFEVNGQLTVSHTESGKTTQSVVNKYIEEFIASTPYLNMEDLGKMMISY